MVAQNRPRAHHPPDVGKPEEPVVGLVVETEPDFLAHLCQASGVGVDRALGFSGGPGGVKDEGARFGIERQRGRIFRLFGEERAIANYYGTNAGRDLVEKEKLSAAAFQVAGREEETRAGILHAVEMAPAPKPAKIGTTVNPALKQP